MRASIRRRRQQQIDDAVAFAQTAQPVWQPAPGHTRFHSSRVADRAPAPGFVPQILGMVERFLSPQSSRDSLAYDSIGAPPRCARGWLAKCSGALGHGERVPQRAPMWIPPAWGHGRRQSTVALCYSSVISYCARIYRFIKYLPCEIRRAGSCGADRVSDV
jgi:hypothetical protein